jgi:hypothetical protein
VWQNISSAGNGMSIKVKVYSAALDTFVPQTTNVYETMMKAAIYALDPTGGGKNIPVGTTYVEYDLLLYNNPTAMPVSCCWKEQCLGATVVTGTTTPGLNGNSLFVEAIHLMLCYRSRNNSFEQLTDPTQ